MAFTNAERCRRWREAHPAEAAAAARRWYHANRGTERKRRKARTQAARKKDPYYTRNKNLRAQYGITQADYDSMHRKQRGRGAICRTSDPGYRGGEYLHVDHDHTTGRVRALLCINCNRGLGAFKDDPKLLQKAQQYLVEHGAGG